MFDPVKLGDAWLDRAAIVGVVPFDDKVLIFLRGGKPITLSNTFSTEELEALTHRPRHTDAT